jgi:hypothetical protein
MMCRKALLWVACATLVSYLAHEKFAAVRLHL